MQAELYHRSRANCARIRHCVKQHRNKQRKIERNYNLKTNSWLSRFTFLAQRFVTSEQIEFRFYFLLFFSAKAIEIIRSLFVAVCTVVIKNVQGI